ncbi:MAG: outer membrane beta-barrel protein [Acidobacteriota bacterium]|nr:outer membrane beta-barrel protein [Acidobacteriota bacterium]
MMQRWVRTQRLGMVLAGCLLAGLVITPAAVAQTSASPDTPLISARGFFDYGYESFAAKQSFTAVFGQSTGSLLGGGAQVVFRNGIYVEIGASRFKKTGQRAYVYNGTSYGLGIPLTATLVPLEVTAGYRYRVSPRIVVYGGGGIGSTSYKETSQFATASENVDKRTTSYQVKAGGEYRIAEWFGVAGEFEYSRVPNILGTSGVSQAYGENNLGGTSLHIKFIVGR